MRSMLAELYVLSGRDAGKLIDAVGPTIFLGRAATNHYRIRDPQASRVHCRIDITTDGLTLQDISSGNGTYLNDEKVEGTSPLKDGDEIRVGATRLRVLIETDEDREAQAEALGSESSLASSAAIPISDALQEEESAEEAAPEESDAEAQGDGEAKSPPEAKPRRALREVLPGYRLQRRLGGHGHRGIAVYRAEQMSLERSVALKVFLPRGSYRTEDVERFLRQAKSIARLPHPNIVTVHDVLSRGKMRVIVTEYLAGGSLADRLDSGNPLSVASLFAVGEGIAGALGYLHTQGIVHRNVKPSNILRARELGTYKLAGFGFATGPAVQRQGDTCFLSSELEGFAFLSPEQLGADLTRIGPATDVYSLGATLYACASAKAPFHGDRVVALAACIMRDPPPPLSGVPESLVALIDRCMHKSPQERYPDGNAVLHELRACRSALPKA